MANDTSALHTLLAKLIEARDGNGWFVEGRLSNAEYAALLALAGDKPSTTAAPAIIRPKTAKTAKPAKVTLDLSLLKAKKPAGGGVLCIDFGTAASKAAVSRLGRSMPQPLDLGGRAGEPDSKPWVTSSIGVSDTGLIVFGPAAENCRDRIASIKSKLWDASDAIGGEVLEGAGFAFSGAGCIVAYLAYLTRLISLELRDRKLPAYLPRRYAMPFAYDPSREKLRQQFAGWIGQAQILADTFGDRLISGIPAAELRGALDALAGQKAPKWFVRDDPACIGEPVAAGNFALSSDVADRALYMIADIGAGTTDFCILAVKNRADGDTEVYRAPGSDLSIEVAGDELDKALNDYIRDELGIGLDPTEAADLERNGRIWKERLFSDGNLDVSVGEDYVPLEIDLADFLQSKQWTGFEQKLEDAQQACFRSTDKGWIEGWGVGAIRIVITGGGAKLPLERALAAERVAANDISYRRAYQPAVPAMVAAQFAVPDDVPRMVVALGGSMPKPPIEHDRTYHRKDTVPPPIRVFKHYDKAATGLHD